MRKLPRWTDEFSVPDSLDILRTVALTHSEMGGAVGVEITKLIRRGDFRALCEFELNYDDMSVAEALHCRQALALFSKLKDLDIGVYKEAVAYDKFIESEEACGETNRMFKSWARGEFYFLPRVEAWLHRAQRKIAHVLGPVPSLDKLGLRFGPGATTATKKRQASVRQKAADACTCSEELFPMAKAILSELPHLSAAWADEEFVVLTGEQFEQEEWARIPVVVHDGILSFAEKNAKTKRTVIIEPVLNGLIQLGYNDYLVPRLAAFGLDLKDQTRNRNLAFEASLTGELATLDLTSASDMNAKELVYHLLPLDWACALGRVRTGHVRYAGLRFTLEKFSSMGNGVTFPLESLIFWALASAVCEDGETVSVYGDDIIVPVSRYDDLVCLLQTVGFKVNQSKSFHNGFFRESCGRDCYHGTDIRPYYQKDWVSNRTLVMLHNFYVRHHDLERAALVKEWIAPRFEIYGPDGYGDGHLVCFNPLGWAVRKDSHRRRGYGGFVFNTVVMKPRVSVTASRHEGVIPLYQIYRRPGGTLFDASSVSLTKTLSKDRWKKTPSGFSVVGSAPILRPRVEALVWTARFARGHGSLATSTPIPEEQVDGESVKRISLPLSDGFYETVSVYTFG